MTGGALHEQARAAGIEMKWRDAGGSDRLVADETLRAVLGALGVAAEPQNRPPLVTADENRRILLPGRAGRYQMTLESGEMREGTAMALPHGMVALPPVAEPGYHRLEFDGQQTTIAVAPPRAFSLEDAAQGKRLWGLAVQLYALRRTGDGGIGDFKALRDLLRAAGARGADAVAISPVHAQFTADQTRFSPYAPSNRAAFNALHIGLDMPEQPAHDLHDLIDWPAAGAARVAMLGRDFAQFSDWDGLADFRRQAGLGLERHAVFEALQAHLLARDPKALDWRKWPQGFRDPASAEVARFARDHENEVKFHAYLQCRASADLAAAQHTARQAGMRIGLIGDLAVGTDAAGSHSWSRPEEVLRNLEIGAPPDHFNRAGQSWGITAFSPLGLQRSGFSAFIEMLRHALRHTGGVRIDHIMGLARLWVIPQHFPPQAGAYLRMPVQDLLRLTLLESHRHRAVILGEDLGTLPEGFQKMLQKSGIAGMRVMLFERNGTGFKAPARWSKNAVGMTTTHDLPSIAGWWQGNDIAWRERLKMAGDGSRVRAAERKALWRAFTASGAAKGDMPDASNGGRAVDAACAHLGHAACTLALLPMEDAAGCVEQPNLPGTSTEHPNWRRRLPADSANLLARPEVAPRLQALAAARGCA